MPLTQIFPDPSEPESSKAVNAHGSEASRLSIRRWEICREDAEGLPGVTARQIHIFKIERRIDRDRPLPDDARELLLELIENHRRDAKAEAASVAERIEQVKQRATPDRLRAIDGAVEAGPQKLSVDAASCFLLNALHRIGIQHHSELVPSVWSDLESLIPYAAVFDFNTSGVPDENLTRRCLFWGAVIRLDSLDGDPPQDTDEFLAWCGLAMNRSGQSRRKAQWWSDFTDRMAGRPGNEVDRRLLDLPTEGLLTARLIKAAYKQAARKSHPDLGGSAERMIQLNQARDRLLQALGM